MRMLLLEEKKECGAVERALKKRGHLVDCVVRAADVLRKNRAQVYDVLVLSDDAPGVNARQLTRAIRRAGTPVQVVVVSSTTDAARHADFLKSGADGYVQKPISATDLVAYLLALRPRKRGTPGSALRSVGGCITLDLRDRTVVVHDASLSITGTEFILLAYLVSHQGKTVTREEILAHVWGHTNGLSSNMADVHVKNVRKKLADTGTDARIETVRGKGYRFTG